MVATQAWVVGIGAQKFCDSVRREQHELAVSHYVTLYTTALLRLWYDINEIGCGGKVILVMMMVVEVLLRRHVCRTRYKQGPLKSSVDSRQLSLLVQVYVDLRELSGLMIGRIKYINKK